MPKSAKKKAAVAATPQNQPLPIEPSVNGLPVVYQKLEHFERSTASPLGPMTAKDWKLALDWETEPEYQKRMVAEKGGEPSHWLYGDMVRDDAGRTHSVHCRDVAGNKVVCWTNAGNRPFDAMWCEDLVHTILSGQWAGPHTVPGETINGETVRISRYGRVLSGQHEGTACVLADERLQASRAEPGNVLHPRYPFWNGQDHCFIETLVVTGMSEDERVLRTIDYVKPRTAADMLYTMPLFRDNRPRERQELTRMLSSAIDMLWTRTDTQGYRTHPEIVGFLERHGRLLECVEHLFRENGAEHRISKLRLSTGQCAALCYLMGSSGSADLEYGDIYRNESPPSQKGLDWSLWDQAQGFWSGLAGDRAFLPVRTALGRLLDSEINKDDNQGLGGRAPEKLAILSRAWDVYKDLGEAGWSNADLASGGALRLSYGDLDDRGNKLPDGQIKLLDIADFGGIDCPQATKVGRSAGPPPATLTREEIERASAEARARRTTQ